MLTKSDFLEIRKIIREEIENESKSIKDELGADINLTRIRLQNDIEELKDRIKNLEIRVTKIHKELKEEIKLIAHLLDKDNMKTLKRVRIIETKLGIPQDQF